MRHARHYTQTQSKPEHPLERGHLTIDRAVGVAGFLLLA
jgi:hypothetical protein